MGFEAPQGLIGQIDETLAITDLSDVAAITGTGTTVVFSVAPTFTGASQMAVLGIGAAASGAEVLSVTGTGTIASAAGAVWDAFHIETSTATLSGSTNVTTATGFNFATINAPALSGTVTVTNSASLYIAGAPSISGGGAITNPYSLWVDAGAVRIDGQITGTSAVVEIGAGTTAHTLRIYNTFTDASNYERAALAWESNDLMIGTQAAGTGTVRTIIFRVGATQAWAIPSTGHLIAVTDNTYNIGAVGATRPATGFFGTSISIIGTVSGTGVLAVGNGTPPTAQADTVALYSTDDTAGNTIPSFFCEGTGVLATGQADSASSVRVKMRINGTVVTLLAI